MLIPTLRRTLDFIETALIAIAGLMLLTMLLTVTVDAVGRYVFNRPLAGNFEFISFFAMVMLTFLALPKVYSQGGHIKLDFLKPVLRRIPFMLSERVNALLGALFFGAIAVYAGIEAAHKIATRETTIGLVQLPIYISFVSFPLGVGVLTLRLALEIFAPEEHTLSVEDEL